MTHRYSRGTRRAPSLCILDQNTSLLFRRITSAYTSSQRMALLNSLHKVSMEPHVWGYSFIVASNTTHMLIQCTLHGNRYFKRQQPATKTSIWIQAGLPLVPRTCLESRLVHFFRAVFFLCISKAEVREPYVNMVNFVLSDAMNMTNEPDILVNS
jgi:hypothetical protein